MEVNDKMIDNLANLARLEFNDQEKTDIKKDLEKMIRFVEKLNELDTTGVAPLLHMSGNLNMLREDAVKGSLSPEEGLKNAPDHDSRFFLVPKVISKPDNAEINSDQP
jgi:aspartyl-tRNA(Asn)/glutamyl-tRNA(Gln) amidotransferase subunit C